MDNVKKLNMFILTVDACSIVSERVQVSSIGLGNYVSSVVNNWKVRLLIVRKGSLFFT